MILRLRNLIIAATLLIVFICTGVLIYTKWEIKQWKESRPPPLVNTTVDGPAQQPLPAHEPLPAQDSLEISPPTTSVPSSVDSSEKPASFSDTEEKHSGGDPIDIISDPSPSTEVTSVSQNSEEEPSSEDDLSYLDPEAPYNLAVVKAGFEDYNANLDTDPEYAYQRLEAAFREQYGDYPEVDIIIETIQIHNSRDLTVDEAIKMTEAFSRITPEPVASTLRRQLEDLHETQRLSEELGEEIPVRYNMKFVTE